MKTKANECPTPGCLNPVLTGDKDRVCKSCGGKKAWETRKSAGYKRVQRKNREIGPARISEKLHDAKKHLEEAKHLYSIVTGRERTKYWYDKITEIGVQIGELEREQQKSKKAKKPKSETPAVVGTGTTGAPAEVELNYLKGRAATETDTDTDLYSLEG